MPLIPRKINYDVFESPRQEGEAPKFHIRLSDSEVISTDDLLNEHLRSSQIGDAKNLLMLLVTALKEELRQGHKVHLDGLGLFEPVLTADVVSRSKPYHGSLFDVDNERVKNINFRPEKQLVSAAQENVTFCYKAAAHNFTPQDEDIDKMLTWVLKNNDSIMRSDLMNTLGMKDKAASRLLDRLVKEGRLVAHGRRGATYYVPTPGNFGR